MVFDVIVWAQDWRHDSFESLTTRVRRERFAELSVPKDIQVFNYISMSLSGDISDFGWDKYLLMRSDCTAPGSLDTHLCYAAWRSSYSSRASIGV